MTLPTLQSRSLWTLLLFLLFLSAGCAPGGARHPSDPGCDREVIFSLANTDRSSPFVKVNVALDGRPVIYGGLPQVNSGDYFYVSTCVQKRHAHLVVRMEAEGDLLEEKREIGIENKMWIVITRVRDLEDSASMQIDISYEEPSWFSTS